MYQLDWNRILHCSPHDDRSDPDSFNRLTHVNPGRNLAAGLSMIGDAAA